MFGFIMALARDIRDDGLKIHASGLAYVTLVTVVPLLAISFSVLKGLGLHNQVEPLLTGILSPLGKQGDLVSSHIISFVDNIKVGVLGFAGLGILVFAVLNMMRRVEVAFNDIWRVRQERSMLQRVRDYLGVLFMGPLFMSLSVAMTETLQHKGFLAEKVGIAVPEGLLNPFVGLLPYALFIFAFTALYMFMPNTQVKIIPAALAATLATLAWKVMGKLFSVFVVGAGSYAAIYSVFATLMLLMVWIYLCWMIVLVGAAAAYYIQNPSSQGVSSRSRALSARVREKAALCACAAVARAFYKGEKPPTSYAIAADLGMPSSMLAEILDQLVKAGILAPTGKGFGTGYVPACPFDETTVGVLARRLRGVEEEGLGIEDIKGPAAVDGILAEAEAAARQALDKKTLKEVMAGRT
ncbi:MAG: YihY family inner membrane protein [Alphaproteobacteria bacterium]|nr:YihY family inner membrane protein [Alphaproteobacteria bacterium]